MLAAIHLVSAALAWAVTPAGWQWQATAAGFAVTLTWLTGLPAWWLAINAVFLPVLSWGIALAISPLWALGALVALMLVYGRIWISRVPLFFSSGRAQDALAGLLPEGRQSFLDVGCGDGRVLARLAAARPDCRFEGIEQALVPWLLARVRCWAAKAQCRIRRGNLWKLDLSAYDVVYAYLSPAVMAEFWAKARQEMRPGSLLVSAFAIPGLEPNRSVEIDDAMRTRLHVWRVSPETGVL
jgi:SAM-dependent methyltransferase